MNIIEFIAFSLHKVQKVTRFKKSKIYNFSKVVHNGAKSFNTFVVIYIYNCVVFGTGFHESSSTNHCHVTITIKIKFSKISISKNFNFKVKVL